MVLRNTAPAKSEEVGRLQLCGGGISSSLKHVRTQALTLGLISCPAGYRRSYAHCWIKLFVL